MRGIRKTFALKRIRMQHPGSYVDSLRIGEAARLSENVRIAHDVEVRSNVSIGRWTYIEPYSFVNNAEIGSFCAVGRNVAIGCFEHPYTYLAVSAKLYRNLLGINYDDSAQRVRIGNDVWIGEKAIVLKGNVGDGAIIGAGAVVTRDVPPCSIVAGVPAKVIGWRFEESVISEYLGLRWWEWPDEEIVRHSELFRSKECWFEVTSNMKERCDWQ